MEDLGLHRIATKFFLCLLMEDKNKIKFNRMQRVESIHCGADPNLTSNIIMGDESYVYGYNPETNQQSSQ